MDIRGCMYVSHRLGGNSFNTIGRGPSPVRSQPRLGGLTSIATVAPGQPGSRNRWLKLSEVAILGGGFDLY